MSPKHSAALAIAVAGLAASGCGASKTPSMTAAATQAATTQTTEQPPAPTGPPLSKKALIAKADLICARVNAVRASNVAKSPQQVVDAIARVAIEQRRANEAMSKLTPPAALASAWEQMLAGYRAMAADIDKIEQAVAEHNSSVLKPLLSAGTLELKNTIAIARSAGFKDCGKRG